MNYAKVNLSGDVILYPYSKGTFRAENPYTRLKLSTPLASQYAETEDAVANNFALEEVDVLPEPPNFDPNTQHLVAQSVPVRNAENRLEIGWDAVDMSAEQIAELQELKNTQVRGERNRLLSGTDWTQLSDAPTNQSAWATYRQALRDLPEQAGFPHNVTWPTKPE